MNKAPEFSEFHDAYGKAYGEKIDRLAAERAWHRLSARDKRAAIAGIQTYADDCRQRGIAMKYPSGYLNLHRWEIEEVGEPQAQPATKKRLSRKAIGDQADLFSQAERKSGEGQQSPTDDPAAPLEGMETW